MCADTLYSVTKVDEFIKSTVGVLHALLVKPYARRVHNVIA
jgi:hypothetical protein